MFSRLRQKIADTIVGLLNRETSGYRPFTPADKQTLLRTLQPGEIMLVVGNQKVSAGINSLTQSTWSPAAI